MPRSMRAFTTVPYVFKYIYIYIYIPLKYCEFVTLWSQWSIVHCREHILTRKLIIIP